MVSKIQDVILLKILSKVQISMKNIQGKLTIRLKLIEEIQVFVKDRKKVKKKLSIMILLFGKHLIKFRGQSEIQFGNHRKMPHFILIRVN